MRENLGVLELELSDDHLERLDRATEFKLGFPRDFLEDDEVHELIFGDTFDLIDDHRARPRQRARASVA